MYIFLVFLSLFFPILKRMLWALGARSNTSRSYTQLISFELCLRFKYVIRSTDANAIAALLPESAEDSEPED